MPLFKVQPHLRMVSQNVHFGGNPFADVQLNAASVGFSLFRSLLFAVSVTQQYTTRHWVTDVTSVWLAKGTKHVHGPLPLVYRLSSRVVLSERRSVGSQGSGYVSLLTRAFAGSKPLSNAPQTLYNFDQFITT